MFIRILEAGSPLDRLISTKHAISAGKKMTWTQGECAETCRKQTMGCFQSLALVTCLFMLGILMFTVTWLICLPEC